MGLVSKVLQRIKAYRASGVKITLGRNASFNRIGLRMNAGDWLSIGDDSQVAASLRTDRSPAAIEIGSRTSIGGSLIVAAEKVTIGDDVLISWDVTIVDHDSHNLDFALRKDDPVLWHAGKKDWTHVTIAPVTICDKVWIGLGVTILKGVTIGEGAVVAARSVVTKSVPPWTLVAGNPARPLKQLPPYPRTTEVASIAPSLRKGV
jgi:acetyltransferase-like isoleucine patch superfamily enzyme